MKGSLVGTAVQMLHYGQAKCIKAKTVYGHVKRMQYNHISITMCKYVCKKKYSCTVAAQSLTLFIICMRLFLCVCEQIVSPGSNANCESVSAEQRDSREGQPRAKLVDVTPPPH